MAGDPNHHSACAICAEYIKKSKTALLSFQPYPQAWSLDHDLLRRAMNSKEEKVAKLLLEHGVEVQSDREDNGNVKSHKTLLRRAVEMNDIERTKSLLQKNADVEDRSHDDSTPLHVAARMGNTEIAEVLLDHGADAISVCGLTLGALLRIAVEQGKAALVKMLLRKVNVKDEDTLLVLAAKRRYREVVKVLLNNGADIDARDKDNKNIVRFAVENRVYALIELLLEAHSDPENNGEPRSKILEALRRHGFGLDSEQPEDPSLLHLAVCRGYSKIVEYLLNSDIDTSVESTVRNGAMALQASVQYSQIEIAKLLIKNKANVNAKDENGNTPLHYALRNFDVGITKLLLAHGADLKGETNVLHKATLTLCTDFLEMLFQHEPALNVNRTNKRGMTVLYHSIASRYIDIGLADFTVDYDACITGIATVLLDKGADVNARTKNGTTALHTAAQQGYQKVVELLLEHKADVNAVGKDGETPLHSSARNGNEEIVKILLDAGATVNARRGSGATALHVAIARGHAKVVRLLMENGADAADKNKKGSTSLHIAAAHRNTEVLETLLNVFDDLDCREKGGITPLHIATLHGHPRIVRLLLDHGSDINLVCNYGKTPLSYAIGDLSLDYCDDVSNDHDEDDDSDEDDCSDEDDNFDEDNSPDEDDNFDEDNSPDDDDNDDNSDEDDNGDDFAEDDDSDEEDKGDNSAEDDDSGEDDNFDEDSDYDEDNNSDEDNEYGENDYYAENDGYESDNYSCRDASDDAYNYDEFDARFEEVSEMLCQHIIKMIAMNRRVSAKNLRCFRFIIDHYKNLRDNCNREIECMKQKKIGASNVSYYDVLTNDMNRLAVYARNKDIVDDLETGDHNDVFDLYLDMLKIRFKKGQKRAGLLDSSVKSLSFLTGCALPDLSTGKIFNYLSNKDLENLIKAGPCSESDS